MQSAFDWLRRCHGGAELLATLELMRQPDFTFPSGDEIGPPHSALNGPCVRCWVFPRQVELDGKWYCSTCARIMNRTRHHGYNSTRAVVVWAKLEPLPNNLREGCGFYAERAFNYYIHDRQHFLLVLPRHSVKDWLQELVLYHGNSLKGVIQFFPTVGSEATLGIGEMICRLAHYESNLSMHKTYVRFFASAYQVMAAKTRERQGLLTFELDNFMALLDMATVFRKMLLPEEQELIRALLELDNPQEEMFYWGRFFGRLTPAQRDMLQAWQIRNWSKEQIKLLYELTDYVAIY